MTKETDYDRLCQELPTEVLDSWQEYTLLRLPIHDDACHAALWLGPQVVNGLEAAYLLKTICPITGTIYVVRVHPHSASAREAAIWINQGIEPNNPAVEILRNPKREYRPSEMVISPDFCDYHDVHCIFDEDD